MCVLQVAYAEYELDAIMLTGSCSEYAPGKQLPPPKGLELNLGTEQQPHEVSGFLPQLSSTHGVGSGSGQHNSQDGLARVGWLPP